VWQRNFLWLRVSRKCPRTSFLWVFQSMTFIPRAILLNLLLQNPVFQISTRTSGYSHGILPSLDDEMTKKCLKARRIFVLKQSKKPNISREAPIPWGLGGSCWFLTGFRVLS
jgi:hypothetical protein